MEAIPYGRQHITEEDIQAVTEALKSDYLAQGLKITKFEVIASISSEYQSIVFNNINNINNIYNV